jgi:hypothetical protein
VPDLKTASDVYLWLVSQGGLEADARDASLLDGMRSRLGLDERSPFPAALADAGVTVERFIEVMFAVVAPYALMMGDLAEMFERNSVTSATGAGEPLRVQFDFSELGEELTFSLEHFRETLRRWTECRTRIVCWSVDALWALHDIFHDRDYLQKVSARPSIPWAEERASMWPDDLWRSVTPPPPRPPSSDPDTLQIAYFVTDLVATLVSRIAAEGPIDSSSVTNLEPGTSTPAPLMSWTRGAVRLIDTDLLTTNLIRTLWDWLWRLEQLGDAERSHAVTSAVNSVQSLVERLPSIDAKAQVEALEELLNLPIWKHRYALYSAWLLVIVERALADYPLTLEPVDGALSFHFRETRLGSFATADGEYELLAEARRPIIGIAAGEGRRFNIQPDYLIRRASAPSAPARVILEAKHYKRADSRGFRAALSDYAQSESNALVLLANYGPVPSSVEHGLDPKIANRTRALGDVRPDHQQAVADLAHTIHSALPGPIVRRTSTAAQIGLMVVDTSGSMRAALASESIREALREIAAANPHARLVAADTNVRQEWEAAATALDVLFQLPCRGGTDLPGALARLPLHEALIVTDDEGMSQLDGHELRPLLVGVTDGPTIRWHEST